MTNFVLGETLGTNTEERKFHALGNFGQFCFLVGFMFIKL